MSSCAWPRAGRQLLQVGDLRIAEFQVVAPELTFEVRAYLPWMEDESESITGEESLDARQVLELAEALDDWLRGRGLR